LIELTESYQDFPRDCREGHMNLGTSLNLTDDMHAYSFLLKFKPKYVFKHPLETKPKSEEGPKTDERC